MGILTGHTSKKILILALVTTLAGVISCAYSTPQVRSEEKVEELLILGKWTEEQVGQILAESSTIEDSKGRIGFLSEQFLGTPYKENTLIGNADADEIFVINLEGMDCFTYMDYVEAMRLSSSFSEFKENLKRVRYQDGEVSFQKRNHFFSDWETFNADNVLDVTEEVGREETKRVVKTLNQKGDGTLFLPGIAVKQREIQYIPSEAVGKEVIGRLRTGDYVGIYSDLQGLDVSHTGIIIKDGEKVYLRHASSRGGNRKVVNEDLVGYISKKPGLVVFRPE